MAANSEKKKYLEDTGFKGGLTPARTGSFLMTILLVLLDVFLLILVIVTVVLKGKELDNYRRDSEFCVRCDDVRLHPLVPMSEFRLSEDRTVCCLKDNMNLSSLVEKFTEHWYRKKLADENPKYALCADEDDRRHSWLKLQGVDTNTDERVSDRSSVLKWKRNHTDGGGDLEYCGIYICVRKSGVYHVYTQLVRDRINSKKVRLLTHRVIVIEEGYEQQHKRVIIDSTRSECKKNGTVTWDTSYIGTVEQLLAGQKVAVTADSQDEFSTDHHENLHQNVFGIIRMG